MEVINRNFISNDWITAIFMAGFILIALMKLYKPQLLLGYTLAFFSQGFIEGRTKKKPSVFSPFHVLVFLFSIIIFSLLLVLLITNDNISKIHLFLIISPSLLVFILIKYLITKFISKLFLIEEESKYFLFSKTGYLYTTSLWLFPVLIISQYWFYSRLLLLVFCSFLLFFRAFLILRNNKKLIFNNFFYFILYFCTLELAPLLIIYKTTTT